MYQLPANTIWICNWSFLRILIWQVLWTTSLWQHAILTLNADTHTDTRTHTYIHVYLKFNHALLCKSSSCWVEATSLWQYKGYYSSDCNDKAKFTKCKSILLNFSYLYMLTDFSKCFPVHMKNDLFIFSHAPWWPLLAWTFWELWGHIKE